MSDRVNWNRTAPHPVALLIREGDTPQHIALIHRDASGRLYGCAQIAAFPHRMGEVSACLSAWISNARSKGYRIYDSAGAGDMLRAYAAELLAAAGALTTVEG